MRLLHVSLLAIFGPAVWARRATSLEPDSAAAFLSRGAPRSSTGSGDHPVADAERGAPTPDNCHQGALNAIVMSGVSSSEESAISANGNSECSRRRNTCAMGTTAATVACAFAYLIGRSNGAASMSYGDGGGSSFSGATSPGVGYAREHQRHHASFLKNHSVRSPVGEHITCGCPMDATSGVAVTGGQGGFSCGEPTTLGTNCWRTCCVPAIPAEVVPVPGAPGSVEPGTVAAVSPYAFTAKVQNQPDVTLYVVGNQDAQNKYIQMLPNGFTINGMSRDGNMESRFYVVKHEPKWTGGVVDKDVLEPWNLGEGSMLKVKVRRGGPDNNDCNVALYLIGMPGETPGANRDWYCDANNVGGNTCWEQDIIESTTGTVCTSHQWGDGGGQGYANGDGFTETTLTYRDGKTIDGDVAYGTGQDVGAGGGSAIACSIWYCDGWPGMGPSSYENCNEGSSVTWTEWEIVEP